MSVCQQCGQRSTHHPHISGEVVPGWEDLCCGCMDFYMVVAAVASDPEDRAPGLKAWMAAHAEECGVTR